MTEASPFDNAAPLHVRIGCVIPSQISGVQTSAHATAMEAPSTISASILLNSYKRLTVTLKLSVGNFGVFVLMTVAYKYFCHKKQSYIISDELVVGKKKEATFLRLLDANSFMAFTHSHL